ncbi:NIPSNAP family protein [Actinokineospora sp. NBRC 105648]|uniref:NIPSNAP family protein n=1 Tax=Actinokineospora sp. NBRC 105648 TaxID=3032206 RepID=UPI0024A144CB|nr:NIPSNAP family protein [Actinokineospora sp. NBRC 105648]GLZ37245.1 NIPSNAP family protein [Actinokineospora sp. NBRC 105648]
MTVLELRRYTLHPGGREVLIELFEREFVDAQLACGITLPGLFRVPAAPEVFLWLRGFDDLDARTAALEAFYGGPVWRAHRDAANATMIDSDDVLLLRPVRGRFPAARPTPGPLRVGVHHFGGPVTDDLARLSTEPLVLATHPGPNGFPALPVREGEHVVVTVSFDLVPPAAPAAWAARATREPEQLIVEPTTRSALR